MKLIREDIDLSGFPVDSYIIEEQYGNCRLCGKYQDLRYGSCFLCSEHVVGEPIPGGHRLWDSRNPLNIWEVRTQ